MSTANRPRPRLYGLGTPQRPLRAPAPSDRRTHFSCKFLANHRTQQVYRCLRAEPNKAEAVCRSASGLREGIEPAASRRAAASAETRAGEEQQRGMERIPAWHSLGKRRHEFSYSMLWRIRLTDCNVMVDALYLSRASVIKLKNCRVILQRSVRGCGLRAPPARDWANARPCAEGCPHLALPRSPTGRTKPSCPTSRQLGAAWSAQ